MKKIFALILSLPIAFGGFIGKSEVKSFFTRIFAVRTVQTVAPKVLKAAPRAAPVASGAASAAGRGTVAQVGRLAAGIGAGIVAEEVYRAGIDGGSIVTDVQAAEPPQPIERNSRSRRVHLADPDKLY